MIRLIDTLDAIVDKGAACSDDEILALQDTSALLDTLIADMHGAGQYGPVGEALVARLRGLNERIIQLVNSRHGLDGMTRLHYEHGP